VGYAIGEDRSDFQAGGRPWGANDFGFTKFTESDNWKSRTAAGNWAGMRGAGVHRGAYHFFHPAVSAVAQANFFISAVRAAGGWEPGDMFAGDFEVTLSPGGMEEIEEHRRARLHAPLLRLPEHRMGASVGGGALQFLDTVRQLAGPECPVLAYTYVSFRSNIASCVKYPLWMASYSASPPAAISPWDRWTLWQNSDRGGQGGGDTNRFNGDRAALQSWLSSFVPTPASWTDALMAELPTLRQGMSDQPGQNTAVGKMQALIAHVGRVNNLPLSKVLADDGSFGPATRAAVEEIQAFFKIAGGNGECGQRTWECLLLAHF
jgi:GH25 family lysozyme M1 (1,4-beta-N-acetylmuramidase)